MLILFDSAPQHDSHSKFLSLPYELKLGICDHLPGGDYPRLARCCKQLEAEITPLIWARVPLRVFGLCGPTGRCNYKRALTSLEQLSSSARLGIRDLDFHARESSKEDILDDLSDVIVFLVLNMKPKRFTVYYHSWAKACVTSMTGFDMLLEMLILYRMIKVMEADAERSSDITDEEHAEHLSTIPYPKLVVVFHETGASRWSGHVMNHISNAMDGLEEKPGLDLEVWLPATRFLPRYWPRHLALVGQPDRALIWRFLQLFHLNVLKVKRLRTLKVVQYDDSIVVSRKGKRPAITPVPVPDLQEYLDGRIRIPPIESL